MNQQHQLEVYRNAEPQISLQTYVLFQKPQRSIGTLKLKKHCSRVSLAFKKIIKDLYKGMGVEGESLIGSVLLMSWQDEEKEKAAMGPLLREGA